MGYNPQGKGGAGLVLVFLLVIILIVLFVMKGDEYEFTKKWHDKVFSSLDKITITKPAAAKNLVIPPSENEWCKIQNVQVGDSPEDPIWDKIIGWDTIDKCCAREVYGYNCALNREVEVQYCFTGNIGGSIKWAMIEGYYGSTDLYKTYVVQQDKEQIPNKPCNSSIYPENLRGEY
jgi:hypothetical protein